MSDIKEKLKILIKGYEKGYHDYEELEWEIFYLFTKNEEEAREEFGKLNPTELRSASDI